MGNYTRFRGRLHAGFGNVTASCHRDNDPRLGERLLAATLTTLTSLKCCRFGDWCPRASLDNVIVLYCSCNETDLETVCMQCLLTSLKSVSQRQRDRLGTVHMQSLLMLPTSLKHYRFRDCPRAGLGNVIVSCCSGNESRLGDCQYVGFGNVTECRTSHFAGAICFNDNDEPIIVFGYTAVCEL